MEIFIVFYDAATGDIRQLEIADTVEEYFQWATVASGYNLSLLNVTEKEWDKLAKNPTNYKVINGKLKYTVEYAVC